ncbi:hypothetical protein YC2023_019728 [Brassica napus]
MLMALPGRRFIPAANLDRVSQRDQLNIPDTILITRTGNILIYLVLETKDTYIKLNKNKLNKIKPN